MIVYLAGSAYQDIVFPYFNFDANRLESFIYLQKQKEQQHHIKRWNRFILDSGAFTFIMSKKKVKVDIDKYTEEYIDFIIENKIENFFEMDVDKVYGYDKVKQLRNRIESRTGRQCIPVFHMNRGISDWRAMVKDYKYISIGIAGKDVGWGDSEAFYKFVMDAKNNDCKVHGLGITGMRSLKRVPFYSVDSSSWTAGNRYKTIFIFNGNEIKTRTTDLKNKRIKNHLALAKHNFNQWNMFSKYMENKIVL